MVGAALTASDVVPYLFPCHFLQQLGQSHVNFCTIFVRTVLYPQIQNDQHVYCDNLQGLLSP